MNSRRSIPRQAGVRAIHRLPTIPDLLPRLRSGYGTILDLIAVATDAELGALVRRRLERSPTVPISVDELFD